MLFHFEHYQNHIYHQNNKHKIRLGILPMKQIIDRAFNRKDNSEWYKEASVNLTKDELDKMQDENDGRYVDKLIGQLNASLNIFLDFNSAT